MSGTPPVSDSDPVELEISNAVGLQVGRATEEYRAQRDTYEHRMRMAYIASEYRTEIVAAAENALADFGVQTKDELNHLHALEESFLEHERALREFRDRHGLRRPPAVVPSSKLHLGVAVIALIFVLEVAVNGMFFAQGSAFGVIGGISEAVGLSVLNIGLAVLFSSLGIPLLTHRSKAIKATGVVVAGVYLPMLLLLNLGVAHFRDLYSAAEGQVSAAQWLESIIRAPLGLGDVQSWILATLGIGFAVVAIIDVDRLRDRYLGYAPLDTRRREAMEAYVNESSGALHAFGRTRTGAVEEMTSVITAVNEARFDFELASRAAARLRRNFETYLEHAKNVYRQLVGRYRALNPDVLQRTAPPRDPVWVPSVGDEPVQGNVDGVQEIVTLIEGYIRKVNSQYEAAASEIRSVKSLADPAEMVCR